MNKLKRNFQLIFLVITSLFIFSCKTDESKKDSKKIEKVLNENSSHQESKEEFYTRMQWWKDAKYGMFIHWGLYSVLAGEYKGEITPKIAEWIQNTLKIPLSEYKKLVKEFNPQKFDVDAWVAVAKAAGMKYIVLTSKHHDGFALFDSKVSNYDIMSTPFKKDIVKQLKDACHKGGLKFGLYYSHMIDWEHPHAYVGKGRLNQRMNTLDYSPDNMNREIYLKEKSIPQLKEILTNYGKIDIIWFDMGGGLSSDEIKHFAKTARELQPEIIISSRIGEYGVPTKLDKKIVYDFYTPSDNYFTGDNLPTPWEMCGTTNTSWGFRNDDTEWRKPKLILNSLIASASRNGNYLLNVGPKANGELPKEPIKNLKIVGSWLKSNGEAIYGSHGSSFPWNYDWGYITEKSKKIYLNIFNWPENNSIELNGLLTEIQSITLLNSEEKLNYKQEGRFLTIDISKIKNNDLATVIVLNHKNKKLKVDTEISQSLNKKIRLDRICSTYNEEKQVSTWRFNIHAPGKFKVEVISNEKARHSNPKWIGSEQKGVIKIADKIIPLELKRDQEEINKSLFFYKKITSNAGEIIINKKGKYSLNLEGFNINAGKWKKGLGLDYILLSPI
ncbi:alpha-L-fucosidase [Lutibacter sp. Hel_I_33_5]|uniref:alpha-L-fucosidase n=1 Tax=Lutibacter sp. Hel_I_33_5 TaxID=1566289 RepID=UPI0011A80D49|nr:alpha-L-fucosidase [Lutibacter sp. Hel_I_33_5]TVZ55650.1 alpha-L-fucosidase [Lutibacter sp. Hel_I_33_5]